MAQVTGLTAARMLDIEANSIVDGGVDTNGNLILTTHNGVEINAGSVIGPEGPKGDDAAVIIAPKPSTDAPSTYPIGVSSFTYGSGNAQGFPAGLGTVFTFIESISRGFQVITDKDTTNVWFRVVGQDVWGAFFQIATKSYVDAAVAPLATSAALATLRNDLSGLVVLTGSGIDLNTKTTSGVYSIASTADATAGSNFPIAQAGILEVHTSGGHHWQRYTPYGNYSKRIFSRAYYGFGGYWSPWTSHYGSEEIGWTNLTPASGFASSPTGAQKYASATLINGMVRFRGVLTGTINVSTTHTVATVPVGLRPTQNPSNFCAIGSTGGFIGWSNVTDAGVLSVHFKSPYASGSATIELSGISYPLE